MLAIPFVVQQSGFTLGLLNIVLVALLITTVHLYLGEITLRTNENHQLTGYAEKYLGKKGKNLMCIAFIFGIFSALVAYLLGESESLSQLIFNNSNHLLLTGIIFWAVLSALSYFGLKALEDGEELGVTLIFVLVISVLVLSWKHIDPANLSTVNLKQIFTPFGVVLFAFLSFAAIPEVKRILESNEEKKLTRQSILIANFLIFVIYTIFTFVVVGWLGPSTPQIATIALGKPFILIGIIALFMSYLALSTALIDTLRLDYQFSRRKAWLTTSLIPLALFIPLSLFDSSAFTIILGLGGVISGGLTAALILMMVKKAKESGDREPEYKMPYSRTLTIILITLFILGTIAEVISIFT